MSFVTIISLTFVILSVINGQTTTESPRDCGPNAKYYTCSNRCPISCSMLNEHPRHFCSGEDCLRGCFCKPGYYRQSVTNLCVLPRDCNRTITP
ncbi:cysteine-rich venom protein 1-like [Leptopilina heterotoma]|uniref:cysteine-rich venom protein 1-like n=1 Tax=Leptopilina heterotoma TaxID=63436 RepID=UPI001CA8F820|nr:cysteine-rich venom protein 1-like [Leptopilina heterotoma]